MSSEPDTDEEEQEEQSPFWTGEPALRIGQFRVHGDPGTVFKALSAAQKAFNRLVKDEEGFHDDHKYVPLPEILKEVVPKLREHGFTLLQPVAEIDGHPHVVTVLGHEDGHALVTAQSVPRPPNMQDFGGNITYSKRYAVEACLALAAQEDDDARHAAQKDDSPSEASTTGVGNGDDSPGSITPKQLEHVRSEARKGNIELNGEDPEELSKSKASTLLDEAWS